jgi:predicted nucleic acid-binding protein
MNENIFIDASFWIALRSPKEEFFELAHAIIAKLARLRPKLVTTLLVAGETHAYLSRSRKFRKLVLDDIESNPIFRIEPLMPEDEKAAFAMLRDHDDKAYSLCDALSFSLMARLRIARVLTFDDHFSQVGAFQVIDHPDSV